MHRLILASASPRRRFLLEKAGFIFSISPSDVSENPDENMSVEDQILDISRRKANTIFSSLSPQAPPTLVLAVDTEVIIDNRLIGKPKDREDAARILRLLSGRTHQVKSALVLMDSASGKSQFQIDTSEVSFRALSEEQIQAYLNLNEFQDKAGAYAMQGAGQTLVEQFTGSWDNIVGIPIQTFRDLLAKTEAHIPRIVAVSKLQSVEKIRSLYEAGQRDFAENYVQEALRKQELLSDLNITWHFIGRIQSNKLKVIAQCFDWIHTLDSLSHATLLNELIENSAHVKAKKVLLQVNIADEKTKSGFEVEALLQQWPALQALTHLPICGLMAMPPVYELAERARPHFLKTRKLLEELRRNCNASRLKSLVELSMGTSYDYKVALEEGASLVRLGTLLFGERKPS